MINKKIITATFIILFVGVLNAEKNGKPLTNVVRGAVVFVVILSLLDAISDDLGKLAGALAILAAVSVLFVELPGLLGSYGTESKAAVSGAEK